MVVSDREPDAMEVYKKVVHSALLRRAGMDAEGSERLGKENENRDDWYAWCSGCGSKMLGTLGELSMPCPGCRAKGII